MKVSITEEATTSLTRFGVTLIFRSEGIFFELTRQPHDREVSNITMLVPGALAECIVGLIGSQSKKLSVL
jgi:hypothetical protein